MKKITYSLEETIEYAKQYASKLKKGGVIILQGELGAGKTQFVKGIGEALGVKDTIISPTFMILNEYKTKHDVIKKLVHVDAYRLRNEQELLDIGIRDYLDDSSCLVVIEWGNKVERILSHYKPKVVKIEFGDDLEMRIIKVM